MRRMTSIGISLALLSILIWAFAVLGGPGARAQLAGDAAAAEADRADLPAFPRAEDLVARRVWAGDSVDGIGAPSPDGRWLSFVDWQGGGNLALRDMRTGEVRLLTHKEGGWTTEDYALFSVFSRDGSRIAFQWWNAGSQQYEIRVVRLADGSIRTVHETGGPQRYVQPRAWSPDGGRLLVERILEDRTNQIAFLDLAGGGFEVVESVGWRAVQGMDLSPDGAWIAYSLPREDSFAIHDVYLLASDGSRKVRLAASDASEEVVGWLPGGGPLFYLSRAGGTTRLLAQELDGARPVGLPAVVRSDMVHAEPMGFFHDGLLYSVVVESRQTRIGSVDLAAGRLTGPLNRVVPSRMERAVSPAWSADGERLFYVVNPALGGVSFPVHMAVRSFRTGAERRFPTPFGYVFNIAPRPGGEELLVQGYGPEARSGIFRMPVGGEEADPVALNGVDADRVRLPRWSTDGRTVYYARWNQEDGDVETVVARDLARGTVREIYATPRLGGFAVSPDGSELAVARQDLGSPGGEAQLLLVDVISGEERELTHEPSPEGERQFVSLEWSPDGEHILYVESGPESEATESLRVIDRDGGEPRVIPTDVRVTRPRVHPDGRRIAVMAGRNRWELWTLEGLADAVVAGRTAGSTD